MSHKRNCVVGYCRCENGRFVCPTCACSWPGSVGGCPVCAAREARQAENAAWSRPTDGELEVPEATTREFERGRALGRDEGLEEAADLADREVELYERASNEAKTTAVSTLNDERAGVINILAEEIRALKTGGRR